MSKVAKTKKKSVSAGIAYISASFNNTTVTITDPRGDTLCWASGGTCGFKGSRKGTPFAGQCAAQQAAEKASKFGVKDLEVLGTRWACMAKLDTRAQEAALANQDARHCT